MLAVAQTVDKTTDFDGIQHRLGSDAQKDADAIVQPISLYKGGTHHVA